MSSPDSQAAKNRELSFTDSVSISLVPITLVVYATLAPRELAVNLGGLQLYADRMALIVVLPWVVYKIFKGAIRFVLPDFLFVLASVWIFVSFWAIYDLSTALVSGGSLALDGITGYFLARISFKSLTAIRKVMIAIVPALGLAGVFLMAESVSHRFIVQPFAESIFGRLTRVFDVAGSDRTDIRMGLMRAKANFSHPIHAGIYMASMLPLYGMSGIRGWPRTLGVFAAATAFFSLSSAGIGLLAVCLLLMFFNWFQSIVDELSWNLLFLASAIALTAIEFSTNIGAIGFVMRYLTLDPGTAFYRAVIWDYGLQSIWAHPWFGIGNEEYERASWMTNASIDSHWLVLGVRFGLIPPIALFIATLSAVIALAKSSKYVGKVDKAFYRGICISLFGFGLMMFTVALWGNVQSWFNLLLGMCVACAQRAYTLGYQPPVVSDAKPRPAVARGPGRPIAAR